MPPAFFPRPRSSSLDVMQMVNMSRDSFERMHATDPCGVDKLKDGIKSFANDQAKLEDVLAELAGSA